MRCHDGPRGALLHRAGPGRVALEAGEEVRLRRRDTRRSAEARQLERGIAGSGVGERQDEHSGDVGAGGGGAAEEVAVVLPEAHAAAAAKCTVDEPAGADDGVLNARGCAEGADVPLAAVLAVHCAPHDGVEEEADGVPEIDGVDELGTAYHHAAKAASLGRFYRFLQAEVVHLAISGTTAGGSEYGVMGASQSLVKRLFQRNIACNQL